jgi:hypothetical protein
MSSQVAIGLTSQVTGELLSACRKRGTTPGARTRAEVTQSLPSPSALLAIGSIAALLGVRVFIWVDTARENDNSILGLVPWLLYPGIVAVIAARSRVERLAIGVAAIVPVAMFAVLYGRERVEATGLAVWLAYVALLLISVSEATRIARRPGWPGVIAAIAGGAAAFLLTVGVTMVALVLLFPIY